MAVHPLQREAQAKERSRVAGDKCNEGAGNGFGLGGALGCCQLLAHYVQRVGIDRKQMGGGLKPDVMGRLVAMLLRGGCMTHECLEGFQKNLIWIKGRFKHYQ
ncbi:hypothetical protein [Paraburkholderia franconis]|uniref:hypothetical protein n=1 Tax=Paraburkholderia franconis TaxID=2654983 RepID=UPI002AAF8AA8|nr:hypothetical protein [Paraburkholderia franconis]